VDEIDIWRSAHLMIEQHSADAEMAAASRVDQEIARGDPFGEATWKRILAAIHELQRSAPEDGGPLH
jgi:hypothetical protein